MLRRQADTLGIIALGLCVAGLVLGIAVGVLAVLYPRTWTMRDAGNTLLAAELIAAFVGALARKSGYGASAMVIAGVLALGAFVFMP
jgi:hypothetical protein